MSQRIDLLNYLKSNKVITARQASAELGIGRLAARINELRTTHRIETDMVEVTTRRGTARVAQYRFVK